MDVVSNLEPTDTDRPRPSVDITVSAFDDDIIVYHHLTKQYFLLNAAAAAIWRNCDGRNSVADIARNVGTSDVRDTLVGLAEFGVLELGATDR